MTDAGRHTTVTAWVWGGALLIASALLPLVTTASVNDLGTRAVFRWIGILAFTAALLLFALGWRGRGSVVARRPVGLAALIMWAIIGPLGAVVGAMLPPYDDGAAGFYSALYNVEMLVWLGAGIVATVAIARAGVVPAPWNRVPIWAFLVVVGVGVLSQVVAVALAGRPGDQDALGLLFGLTALLSLLAPMLLGILAIVLGLRIDPRPTVQVYPPAS